MRDTSTAAGRFKQLKILLNSAVTESWQVCKLWNFVTMKIRISIMLKPSERWAVAVEGRGTSVPLSRALHTFRELVLPRNPAACDSSHFYKNGEPRKLYVCVVVCVWERGRERERESKGAKRLITFCLKWSKLFWKWGVSAYQSVSEGIFRESVSPCVILLKTLQLVPLLSQRGLQIQIGAIVGQLQRTVIKL